MLQKRILSSVIAAPATLGVIIYGGWPFLIFIAAGVAISICEFFGMERKGKNLWLHMVFWCAYVLICGAAFIQIRMSLDSGVFLVFALFLTVWACDIGAYVCGKTVGGPKMAPRLSPNKTWAGLIGGMISSGVVLCTLDYVSFISFDRDIFMPHIAFVFIVGCFLGAVGQAGDLLVSSVKRRVGVKDTGHFLPGHGGFLDRIDSLLLVTPVFLVLCKIWLI